MNEWLTELWSQNKKTLSILAALLVLCFLATRFLLLPARQHNRQAKENLNLLRHDNQERDTFIAKAQSENPQRAPMQEEIAHIANRYLPPCQNSTAWITEQAYNLAEPAGVRISALTELEGWSPAWSHAAYAARLLKSCGVRIEMETDNAALIRFIRALETSNPYLSVSQITIISRDRVPGKNIINLIVEWPQWCGN